MIIELDEKLKIKKISRKGTELDKYNFNGVWFIFTELTFPNAKDQKLL